MSSCNTALQVWCFFLAQWQVMCSCSHVSIKYNQWVHFNVYSWVCIVKATVVSPNDSVHNGLVASRNLLAGLFHSNINSLNFIVFCESFTQTLEMRNVIKSVSDTDARKQLIDPALSGIWYTAALQVYKLSHKWVQYGKHFHSFFITKSCLVFQYAWFA